MRRRLLVAVLSAVAPLAWGAGTVAPQPSTTIGAAASAVTTPAYADAVTFQQDAARDGYAGPTNLPSTLQRSWSLQLPQRVSYAVIAGGRVFVTVSRSPSAPTTTSPEVFAYDGATGARLWGPYVVPGQNSDFAMLAYDGGRLFVVSQEGFVAALQPASGAQLWSRTVAWAGVAELDAPIALQGHLYEVSHTGGVVVWSMNEANGVLDMLNGAYNGPGGFAVDSSGFYLDQGNGVSALTTGGVQRWRQEDAYKDFGDGVPVLHAGQMWIRSQPQQHILQASTGDLVGTFSSDTPPAFAGNTVVEMNGSGVTAASATTLAHIWTQKGDGQLDTNPVIAGSVVYVGSKSGSVYGYSLSTGQQVWVGQTGAPVIGSDVVATPAVVQQNPTIGDGLLAVPSGDRLTVFGATAAAPQPPGWSANPVPPVLSTPPVTVTYPDDVAYQEDPAHDGYAGPALPSSLHQRWSHTFTGIPGTPVIVGGRIFVPVWVSGATDVYAFSASTGAQLWGPVAVPDTTQSPFPGAGGGITYDGGRIFVLSGSGTLEALSPTTGAVLWRLTYRANQVGLIWPGPPVASGGLVYSVGSYSIQIANEATGASVGGAMTDGSPSSIPAVNSHGAFLNFPQDDAELFSPAGKLVWDDHTGEASDGPAAVLHGSQVWIRTSNHGGDGEVLDQATGRVQRTFDSDTPPAFSGNYGVLDDLGTLAGIDATTGATTWSEAGDAFLDSPPVIAGTTAYVTSRLGMVYGYNVATGVQTWRAALPGFAGYTDDSGVQLDLYTGLAIGDGYLAVPNSGTTLTVFGG